jgi:sulfate/thiosulfate transport system permease protein
VAVVAGNVRLHTQTMPLVIQSLYEGGSSVSGAAAFAVASLLALLALLTLGIKTFLEWKQARDFELAQQTPVVVTELDTSFFDRGNPQ